MMRAFSAFAIVLCAANTVGTQPVAQEQPAKVDNRTAFFLFPAPYAEVETPNPPVYGYYVWRVSIDEPALDFMVRTDRPVATTNFRELVEKNTSIRSCPSGSSTPEQCTEPLAGTVRLTGAGIELRITDENLVQLLRRARPVGYWRTIHLPGGRFMSAPISIKY